MKKAGLIFVSLMITVALSACGGGQAANLAIQLSPSAPTLAINSNIVITAQTTPPVSGTNATLTWQVVGYSGQCTEGENFPESAPPIPGCNNGYIAYSLTTPGPITSVYYFAPGTTGTYQISVFGQILNGSNQVVNQGKITATVAVTPPSP